MGKLAVAAGGCVLVAIASSGCARRLHAPETIAPSIAIESLWREPEDIRRRNLFDGPGGAGHAPGDAPFIYVDRKTTGVNPGFDVRDAQGIAWSVKLGREAQSEVAVSRILWAMGYHQPATYYVPRWRLTGAVSGEQPAARFRREPVSERTAGEWSWYDNPFIGTRPFAGLIAVNLLFNNWDLKTSNNKIYEVSTSRGLERRYVVRDLGGSLGRARQSVWLRWLPFMRYRQGSRNDLDDFERQPFIETADGERVQFSYRGIDHALAESVSMTDLQWMAAQLEKLSLRQWSDAFRAAGYTPDQIRRYVHKAQDKLAEVRRITAAPER